MKTIISNKSMVNAETLPILKVLPLIFIPVKLLIIIKQNIMNIGVKDFERSIPMIGIIVNNGFNA